MNDARLSRDEFRYMDLHRSERKTKAHFKEDVNEILLTELYYVHNKPNARENCILSFKVFICYANAFFVGLITTSGGAEFTERLRLTVNSLRSP